MTIFPNYLTFVSCSDVIQNLKKNEELGELLRFEQVSLIYYEDN